MNINNLKNKNIHFIECENWYDVYGYEKSQMKVDTINYIEHLQQENKKLKDNWNMLKEWVNKHYDYYINNEDYIGGRLCFIDMKDKMQELQESRE